MKTKRFKMLSLIVGITLIFLLISGCGQQQESQPSDSEQVPQQEAEEPIKIGVVVKALNSDFWKTVEAGAKAAGKDLGIEVEVLGPSAETAVSEQIDMIEDQITKRVSALAVAPSQPASAIPVFDQAKAAGIPVVLIDTDAQWDDKVSFVGTGNYNGGKQAGEFIAEKLGKGGKVVILRGAVGDPTHDERSNGAIEVLKEKGLEILDIQPANSERGLGMTVMENMLQVHSDIQGMFATNDEMALGALRAIQAAGKEIITVGFDGSPDALKSIEEGELTASVAQNSFNIGYQGVVAAVKAVRGEAVDKRIDTGTKIISKDNVKEEQQKLKEILGQ
ncbi:Periplasmic binding protein/LacI transcriptional regulator [Tepidanaerobacter acetatoxydans Re1]|uniref:Periplasmic binding protein/LacI transcriptional regulator n=1 Tax=Tepidanaerobacter acetatoxydans (strain DSM 21804 / JCM 16047 / Re1) TaxID=1209989 RepID=F4LW61_TEPAE|nr:sugar ABC transporter substrate-binding protein [Tepidanaerobacter acetatoxydans]AEE90837.1 periplasmic binding protein/LacI transcriptional regulator [Tepidanaerobacter acetatoxydans Re1]CDI40458.1 Periplasmic binding protein/LacI transcriptional regulator [Tepidanaerobacter acetatoxydans Re1]